MRDGYGFGAEGDWKTAAMVRAMKVMSDGLPGGVSFMEDYTYHLDRERRPGPGRPHARGLRVDRRGPAHAWRSTHCRSAARPTRSGSSSMPIPGRAIVASLTDLGDRFRIVVDGRGRHRPARAAAAPAGRPGHLGPAAGPRVATPRPGSSPAARITPRWPTRSIGSTSPTWRRCAASSTSGSTRRPSSTPSPTGSAGTTSRIASTLAEPGRCWRRGCSGP